jgi:hypothetical protein
MPWDVPDSGERCIGRDVWFNGSFSRRIFSKRLASAGLSFFWLKSAISAVDNSGNGSIPG